MTPFSTAKRMKARTKEIKIRLTNAEYQQLIERKSKPRLAQWLRELALEQAPKPKPKTVDPRLLFELNRIGVNLNQIARQCNQSKPSIDLISVATALRNFEQTLTQVIDDC